MGDVTGPKTFSWSIEYSGCSADFSPCNTHGQKTGAIKTDPLEATLVFLDKAHTQVGLRLRGLGPGGRIAEYECSVGIHGEAYGELLTKITGDINTASKEFRATSEPGPLRLQSYMYEEEAASEEQAKAVFEWKLALEACERGEAPFPVGPHSQAECELFVGPQPAPTPVSLLAVVTGAVNGRGPAVWMGETISTGEAFMVATAGAPGEGGEGGEPESGSISGTITNQSHVPVDNVKVSACEEEIAKCYTAETDAAGHYSLPEVAEGFYVLTATPPTQAGYAETATSEEFLVTQGPVTQDLKLLEAGSVTGTVSDESSAPLGGIEVSVCNEETGDCHTAETEAGGQYTVADLPDGKYLVTATAATHSGYASASDEEIEVTGKAATTDNFTLPEAGSIVGTVTGMESNPIDGARISVCDLAGKCYSARTGPSGSYTVSDVADGKYVATVSPPTTEYNSLTSSQFAVSDHSATTEDFTLTGPQPLPNGTKVSGVGTSEVGGVQVPIIHWEVEAPITTKACTGGHVTATVTGVNTQTGAVESTTPVTLTESAAETFSGVLPKVYPIHGQGQVVITVTGCPKPSEDEDIEFTLYIDPSGIVTDSGTPVAGATAKLLEAPTRLGPFTEVPNGSEVMSPDNRKNPDLTNAMGEFGWDTVAGYYEVEASKSGCGRTVTEAFKVPPPVTNLEVVLHCAAVKVETTSLPTAKRDQQYEVQLEVGGEHGPFKWKKSGKLPKGLKLSKGGLLSGTIPSKKVAAGMYPVNVSVKDAAKHTATAGFMLKVN